LSLPDKREKTYTGSFYFDPADPIYLDHFPGRPTVPGSLIVEAFIRAAEQIPDLSRIAAIEQFRFKRFLAPGTYAYGLEVIQSGETAWAVQCRLYAEEQLVASGVLR
jgi:3-hydroxyacyl-[acyl-carrier-protein] dehydratase